MHQSLLDNMEQNIQADASERSPILPGDMGLSGDTAEIVIEPRRGWRGLNVSELWRYRELLYFLTWRDIKIRYKQSLMGVAWAIIQPLMYMAIFTIVFSRMAKVPANGIPYPLFAFSGLLPWIFFASAITQAGNSVVMSAPLITKVYFPRLAIPFAAVGASLFDFFVSLSALAAIILYYIVYPSPDGAVVILTWRLLLVPVLVVLAAMAALGVGTLLGALSVAYRDFKHTIPFLVQLWMFATPTIYMGTHHGPAHHQTESTESSGVPSIVRPSGEAKDGAGRKGDEGVIPDRIQNLLWLNPMTGLIYSFRAAILGQPIPWHQLSLSTSLICSIFLIGCFYFHRVEDSFADII